MTIAAGGQITVGRAGSMDFKIMDPGMSREHFLLKNAVGRGCWIQDQDSSNGVLVNDVKVRKTVVRNGDVIRAGDTKFKLTINSQQH